MERKRAKMKDKEEGRRRDEARGGGEKKGEGEGRQQPTINGNKYSNRTHFSRQYINSWQINQTGLLLKARRRKRLILSQAYYEKARGTIISQVERLKEKK